MKMKVAWGLALLAIMASGHAMAAVEDCPAPAEDDPYAIAVVGDITVPLPKGCRGVDYTSSLGPIPKLDDDVLPVVGSTVVSATDPGTLPDGMAVVGSQAPETVQSMNPRQLERLGELDAIQGRPLDMKRASDLGYLQGYTHGQIQRQQGGNGGFGR